MTEMTAAEAATALLSAPVPDPDPVPSSAAGSAPDSAARTAPAPVPGAASDRTAQAQVWATLAVAEELAALRAQVRGVAAAVERLDGTDSSLRQILNTLHAIANRP